MVLKTNNVISWPQPSQRISDIIFGVLYRSENEALNFAVFGMYSTVPTGALAETLCPPRPCSLPGGDSTALGCTVHDPRAGRVGGHGLRSLGHLGVTDVQRGVVQPAAECPRGTAVAVGSGVAFDCPPKAIGKSYGGDGSVACGVGRGCRASPARTCTCVVRAAVPPGGRLLPSRVTHGSRPYVRPLPVGLGHRSH